MIINIRGTSGSGKSTLVRSIISLYQQTESVFVENRKQPLFYRITSETLPTLSVIGHYETPCGGCDTLKTMDQVFDLVRERHEAGDFVLFEGLLASSEFTRTVLLNQVVGGSLVVVELSTDIALCTESVNLRRRTKNPLREDVNPKNTISKYKSVMTVCNKLECSGVRVLRASREEAVSLIERILHEEN